MEAEWENGPDELQRARDKIQSALNEAKDRAKKNVNIDDITETKFYQLQTSGIKLLDSLKEIGCYQHSDWISIIERVCGLLVPLKPSLPFMTSTEDSEIKKNDLKERQTTMMELTKIIGRKLLFEGKHNQAVPAAVQCLKFSIDVHGLNSVNLVPAYLILGEASIGLGKLSQADEYLAQAEWTVLKSADTVDAIKSKLYRNIGLLHAAKGNYEAALRLLAEDIYHASSEWGTCDIKTSGGYFHMANVFFRQNKMDIADSLYTQVTKNWFDFLLDATKRRTANPTSSPILGKKDTEAVEEELLDEAQEAEAIQMLNAIFDIREQSSKVNFPALFTITQTLSMLYFLLGDIAKAQDFNGKALAAKGQLPASFPTVDIPPFVA